MLDERLTERQEEALMYTVEASHVTDAINWSRVLRYNVISTQRGNCSQTWHDPYAARVACHNSLAIYRCLEIILSVDFDIIS